MSIDQSRLALLRLRLQTYRARYDGIMSRYSIISDQRTSVWGKIGFIRRQKEQAEMDETIWTANIGDPRFPMARRRATRATASKMFYTLRLLFLDTVYEALDAKIDKMIERAEPVVDEIRKTEALIQQLESP